MKNAYETIKGMIKNRVWMLNEYLKTDNTEQDKKEVFERFDGELHGMLLCLKNIEDGDNFYNLNYFDNRVEFGFYDADGGWNVIEG